MATNAMKSDIAAASMVTCTVVLPHRYLKLLRRIAAVRGVQGGLANGRRPSISSVMREILDPVIPALEAELRQSGIGDAHGPDCAQFAGKRASGD